MGDALCCTLNNAKCGIIRKGSVEIDNDDCTAIESRFFWASHACIITQMIRVIKHANICKTREH